MDRLCGSRKHIGQLFQCNGPSYPAPLYGAEEALILVCIIIIGVEIFVYLRIDGVLSRAGNVHHDKHHQVDECQFTLGDASLVNVEEGNGHHHNHWNHGKSIERPEDESCGAKHFGKDGEKQ